MAKKRQRFEKNQRVSQVEFANEFLEGVEEEEARQQEKKGAKQKRKKK